MDDSNDIAQEYFDLINSFIKESLGDNEYSEVKILERPRLISDVSVQSNNFSEESETNYIEKPKTDNFNF